MTCTLNGDATKCGTVDSPALPQADSSAAATFSYSAVCVDARALLGVALVYAYCLSSAGPCPWTKAT
jgi:hypothetical protein